MDVASIIGTSYLAKGFTDEFVQRVALIGEIRSFKAGELILEENDANCDLMILAAGEADVETSMGDKIAKIIATTPFGEVAFLDRKRRSSSVVASSDCQIIVLPEEPLRELFRQEPEMAVRALVNLSTILCERLRRATRQIAVLNAIEESHL